jgi:hypothetical protein
MRLVLAAWLTAFTLLAQSPLQLNVDQLLGFVRSSVKLRHPDKQVAEYLRKVKLTQKLEDRTIEVLLADGIGPKTAEALRVLRDASATLAAPPPKAATPAKPQVVIPPPPTTEQAKILDQVREFVLDYDKRLPNFICMQVTRRFQDPSGLEVWNNVDTITAKLSYFENKEQKQVMFVNNRYVDIDYDKLGGGATSTGEFGNLLKGVFERDSLAEFGWERWATLRGRLHYVFNYRVRQTNSKWKIYYDRALDITPGYSGLLFVDADYKTVSRIVMTAEDVPPSFPVQMARTQLDYDFADIAGQQFLLPLRSELRMRSGKQLLKNEVEFRSYRRYGADIQIKFDVPPEPIAEDKLKETPATSDIKSEAKKQ